MRRPGRPLVKLDELPRAQPPTGASRSRIFRVRRISPYAQLGVRRSDVPPAEARSPWPSGWLPAVRGATPPRRALCLGRRHMDNRRRGRAEAHDANAGERCSKARRHQTRVPTVNTLVSICRGAAARSRPFHDVALVPTCHRPMVCGHGVGRRATECRRGSWRPSVHSSAAAW